MGEVDPILLARIQFAANITFHILFPTITIGLAWVLFFFKQRFHRTGDEKWMAAYRLWVKVFALTFALGVVSGVTMSFQFGTNWPGFMEVAGNIAGPLLAYEILTAFFLEATFLGIMLFGTRRVSPRLHTLATLLVAIGTSLSAFWILALNSWMQTPQGHRIEEGIFYAESWWQIIFNPSLPYRLTHMLLACFITAAFLLAGLSAYRWLRGDRGPDVLAVMRTGVLMAAVLTPLQVVVGDLHGLNTLEHQPAKIAAMEGIWSGDRNVAAVLFGWPNQLEQRTDWAIEVPGLASFILTHDWQGELQGIADFPDAHPPVAPVFFAFRIMVGMGMLMVLVSLYGAWRLRRRGSAPGTGLARALLAMTFSGWVALVAGWYVTEIGRQPWLVYGLLTTAEAASDVPAGTIGISLTLYLGLYAALLAAYVSVLFYMARRAGDAPPGGDEVEVETPQPMLVGNRGRAPQ